MTTYTTIKEAFAAGTGDNFFTKDGKFVAVSRKHDTLHQTLQNQGFTYLNYEETIKLAAEQEAASKREMQVLAKDIMNLENKLLDVLAKMQQELAAPSGLVVLYFFETFHCVAGGTGYLFTENTTAPQKYSVHEAKAISKTFTDENGDHPQLAFASDFFRQYSYFLTDKIFERKAELKKA